MKTKNNKTNLKQDVGLLLLGLLSVFLSFLLIVTSSKISNLRSNLTLSQNTIIAQKANLTALQTSLSDKEALIENLSLQLQNQSKLLNLSVTKILFNSTIFVKPAYNYTVCAPLSYCVNTTEPSNYSMNFTIQHAGYILISASSNANLFLFAYEKYAKGIPQYYTYLYFGSTIKTAGFFAELNSTTSPVVVPVLPGNVTLFFGNLNMYPVAEQVEIKYVS